MKQYFLLNASRIPFLLILQGKVYNLPNRHIFLRVIIINANWISQNFHKIQCFKVFSASFVRIIKFNFQKLMSEGSSLQNIKANYQFLLQKYAQQAEQIENINDLYAKFRNLKLYQIEYDKHEELKKQLSFWNNPTYHKKSQREQQLQAQLHQLLQQNQQYKVQGRSPQRSYK